MSSGSRNLLNYAKSRQKYGMGLWQDIFLPMSSVKTLWSADRDNNINDLDIILGVIAKWRKMKEKDAKYECRPA
jgi:hypothetical protein